MNKEETFQEVVERITKTTSLLDSDELYKVKLACSQFTETEVAEHFFLDPLTCAAMASLLSLFCNEHPEFKTALDALVDLIRSFMTLGIVLWEDQELKEPK